MLFPSGQLLLQGEWARVPSKIQSNYLAGAVRTRTATCGAWAAAAWVVRFKICRICEGKRQTASDRTANTYTDKPVIVTWIADCSCGVNYTAVVRIAEVDTGIPLPAESSTDPKTDLVEN